VLLRLNVWDGRNKMATYKKAVVDAVIERLERESSKHLPTSLSLQVIDAVIEKLEREKQQINYELNKNKREFRKLIDEQTSLKRQKVVLQGFIRSFDT